jgi:5-methylcytosine-specific restriction endonuclease McrA
MVTISVVGVGCLGEKSKIMGFPDTVKLQVKRKAHFKCCICQQSSVSLEVHHIVSKAEGGPDTEDNAAPLCPSCHEDYGANPVKRTAIRVQRDFWYEICEKRSNPEAAMSQRVIDLLEGATSAITGFQEYVSRLTGQPTPVKDPVVDAYSEVLPAVISVTSHDSVVIGTVESSTVEKFYGEESEDDEGYNLEHRSEIEILEALEKLFDQIWYNRHWNHRIEIERGTTQVTPEIWKQTLAAAARVEEKYKDDPDALGPWSDFDWGMLNGKMSALRWIMGDEWDFLDT